MLEVVLSCSYWDNVSNTSLELYVSRPVSVQLFIAGKGIVDQKLLSFVVYDAFAGFGVHAARGNCKLVFERTRMCVRACTSSRMPRERNG